MKSAYTLNLQSRNEQMRLLPYLLGLLTCIALMGIPPTFAESSVSVNAIPSASNLPLDGEGSATTRVVKVSSLTLATDSNKGFTVTISSGSLTKVSSETPISYQVMTVAAEITHQVLVISRLLLVTTIHLQPVKQVHKIAISTFFMVLQVCKIQEHISPILRS